MCWTRADFIREFDKLIVIGLSEPDKYYDIERPLVRALEGNVVILKDGKTCLYIHDSGLATARLVP